MSTIGRQIYIYIHIYTTFHSIPKGPIRLAVSVGSLTSRCSRNERVTPSGRTKTGPKTVEEIS